MTTWRPRRRRPSCSTGTQETAIKRKAVEEADSGDSSNTLLRNLNLRVKTLEAEIERIKEKHRLLPSTERSRSRRRDPAAAAAGAAGRHIPSLGDDLLLEIFLRLPSLATLVRATCTCLAWRRAVASSPDFRRRFRALHPPILLGFFFIACESSPTRDVPDFPAFVPARTRDRDQAAAIRGGDFFLTSLLGRLDEPPCWDIMHVSRGYALLMNCHANLIAVFNPVTRHTKGIFNIVSVDTATVPTSGLLFWEDEESISFRVVLLTVEEDKKVRLIVFTSDTGFWSVGRAVDFPARPDGGENPWLSETSSKHTNGILYWVYEDHRYMTSLNVATMEFSVTELPQCLIGRSFYIGHTKDGKTCIVYADKFIIGVCLMQTCGGNNGVDRWVHDSVVPMDVELHRVLPIQFDVDSELDVLKVRDGYVYLATSRMHQIPHESWFLTLCLETMKLEVLFRKTYDGFAHAYIMAWPPSLLGNNH
ncbi:hypothetical protein HU200_036464 [Digitaria exilis]|uniref:F-box domain-containing protein n=1 Tax=Digitaria exilis TaxID=1010633 RepID=A0A835EKX9_9POAL|nr:hypothetical protein HU200_036464 [Digitaria exilis]CAB3477542.1 unnamed protein product [Digitaria exilis]